jgi:hypothetical protein
VHEEHIAIIHALEELLRREPRRADDPPGISYGPDGEE